MKTDNDNIKLDILTERPAVRKDQASELDIVIEIHTKQPTEAIENPKKLNLCVVIDRSGSMSGDKLEAAKRSCIDIYKRLGDEDLFTVVVFNDEAEVAVNPQTPKTKVIEKIDSISSDGMTNLSLGWYLGLLELQTYMTENHNNRLFLLSDGQANRGETKKTILAQEASRSRRLGVTTSTIGIGIGNDFQEELLDAIATESGGRFWYIQESRIEDIMEEEFKGALSVIIDRPRIELKLPKTGVTVSKELNAVKKSFGKYCPRPIRGESRFNFAVRLEIMPEAIKGEQFTLEATLSNGEKSILSTQKTVSLQSFQECIVSESNPIVKSVVEQYEVTVTNEDVIKEMSDGSDSSLDLVKKMLVTEVEGMHKVKDALEEKRESERIIEELAYFGSELQDKETSLLFAETFENFVGTVEVQDFLKRWKKVSSRDQHRMIQRENAFSGGFDRDLQVDLLTNAIDLIEVLIQRFPDKKNELIAHKDRLHVQMARYK